MAKKKSAEKGRPTGAELEAAKTHNDTSELEVGKHYMVINSTDKTFVGRLRAVVDPFTVALEDAAWIAESGRLHEFIRDGKAANMEVEVVGTVVRARWSAIIPWPHDLFYESV